MLKRSLIAVALLTAGTTLAACGGSDDAAKDAGGSGSSPSAGSAGGKTCDYESDGSGSDVKLPPSSPTKTGKVPVTISSSVGDLKLTLDADKTPCTVNSFVSLADQGFYEGIYCHRIGDPQSFPMLQCGDPTATDPDNLAQAGSGGPGYSYADELTGAEKYGPGTLAMANAGADTNGSQFFMVFGDIGLDPAYTVFGTIAPDTVKTLESVAAKGSNGSNPDGTGAPNTPVKFTKVTVG
ncbi:peptidylprolyl isomerase [Nocardioides sp. CER19]|uniref:peptidylprolyl isomerase n=1 Tax=Nocardioides sp. CER19 TaxID=3038538 RepID=UPI00244CA703|nr:peptidylprolyl isomerase [Nocardioides sp. CER19]MDH2415629.1 peptidylprolyl isomerase [Nocardioides sp. CER19]